MEGNKNKEKKRRKKGEGLKALRGNFPTCVRHSFTSVSLSRSRSLFVSLSVCLLLFLLCASVRATLQPWGRRRAVAAPRTRTKSGKAAIEKLRHKENKERKGAPRGSKDNG